MDSSIRRTSDAMTTAQRETALPHADAARKASAAPDVCWFGQSRRIVGGQPDSRYGWWGHEDGPRIVKAMDTSLTAYGHDWLAHERKMLTRLRELEVRVPQLVPGGPVHWLVTRFEGVSLERLNRAAGTAAGDVLQPLQPLEQLSVWVHLLESLDKMARYGVLATDIYAPNVLLPLTDTTRGQFRLAEPVLIDHAHTLVAGSDLRRPSLIGDMKRMAPELRELLRRDIDAARQALRAMGASLPTAGSATPEEMTRDRRAWMGYRQEQALQSALDTGHIDPGPAMQFAVGVAVRGLLPALAGHPGLKEVIKRMTADDKQARYATPAEAAAALRVAVGGRLPFVSKQHCQGVRPRDLVVPVGGAPQANGWDQDQTRRCAGAAAAAAQASFNRARSTAAAESHPQGASSVRPRGQRPLKRPHRTRVPRLGTRVVVGLAALAGAVGGVAGTLLPPGLATSWWVWLMQTLG